MAIPDEFTVVVHGHRQWTIDVRNPEMFDAWLSTLGPSATLLWHYLARRFGEGHDEFTIHELAVWSGLNDDNARSAIDRLTRFQRIHWVRDTVASVEVGTIPPRLTGRQTSNYVAP